MTYRFDLSGEEFEEHRRYELNIPPKWRRYVLKRDSHACRRCNFTDNLEIHHVVPRSDRRDHHPRNLITLCHHCHREIHDGRVTILITRDGNAFFGGSRADLLRFYR